MKCKDIKIAGAGLFGCTCARQLAEAGFTVEVVDRRGCIGGNAASYYKEGIEVHQYGCHIFHTSNEDVWRFANRFAKFNQYQHHCIALHNGRKHFLPFNLALLESFFNASFASPDDAKKFVAQKTANDTKAMGIDPAHPKNFEEQAIALIGKELYDAFVKNYTKKQWNCDPKLLDASIIRRLPIRYNCNVSYYDDKWQGVPIDGYSSFIANMLDHSNIKVELSKDYTEDDASADISNGKLVIFTGAVDELFKYKLGALSWRSLRFETEVVDTNDFQGNSTVNYVDADVPFTRIHEFKHFRPDDSKVMKLPCTVIQREFPDDWAVGKERYYPVNNAQSTHLHSQYVELAKQKFGKSLVFGGRLGMYKYFDMDDTIDAAMQTSAKLMHDLA